MKFYFVLLTFVFSCGDAPKQGGEGPGGESNAQSPLSGDNTTNGVWSGFLKLKNETTLKYELNMTIKNKDNFEITVKNDNEKKATGRMTMYTEDNSLYLDIFTSTISEIGAAGTKQLLSYTWKGDILTASGVNYELKFRRDRSDNSQTAQNQGTQKLDGRWKCDEGAGRFWVLTFSNLSEFNGKILSGSSATTQIKGKCAEGSYPKLCVISESSEEVAKGIKFFIELNDSKNGKLGRVDKDTFKPSSFDARWFSCASY